MNQFNFVQSFIFFIPFIMIGVGIGIIIIILYKNGNLSEWFSKRPYGKIQLKDTSFNEIKIQRELEKINYTCKFCKAELKGPKCEYCNRINFQI